MSLGQAPLRQPADAEVSAGSDHASGGQQQSDSSATKPTPADRLRTATSRFGKIRPLLRSRKSKRAFTAAATADHAGDESVIAAHLRVSQGTAVSTGLGREPLTIAPGWGTSTSSSQRQHSSGSGSNAHDDARPGLRITAPEVQAGEASRLQRSGSTGQAGLQTPGSQSGKTPPPAPPRRGRSLADIIVPPDADEQKHVRPGTPAPSHRMSVGAGSDISLMTNPLHRAAAVVRTDRRQQGGGRHQIPVVVSSRHLASTPLPPPIQPHGRAREASHSTPLAQTGAEQQQGKAGGGVIGVVNPMRGRSSIRGGGVQSRPASDNGIDALASKSGVDSTAQTTQDRRQSHVSIADSASAAATPVSVGRSDGATSGKRSQRPSMFSLGWLYKSNPPSPTRQPRQLQQSGSPSLPSRRDSKVVPDPPESSAASDAGTGSKYPASSKASEGGTMTESERQRARSEADRMKQNAQEIVLLAGDESGIPLREGLQSLYRIGRSKLLAEGCLFLVQFLLLTLVVGEAFDARQAFKQEIAMRNAVLGDGLARVGSIGDIWDWLETSALPGLWPTELYPGDSLLPQQLGMVSQYNQLVGPVELRLARVGPDSCTNRRFLQFGRRFDTPDGSCFAEFVPGPGAAPLGGTGTPDPFRRPTEATAPFGVSVGNTTGLGRAPYEWSHHTDSMAGRVNFGEVTYGYGGYSIFIPNTNATRAREVLQHLRDGRFIDKSARALGVHATFYNTNTRLLQSLRVVIEQFPSGLVSGSHISGTARLLLYEDRLGISRGVGEVLMCLLILWAMLREARRFYHTHPRKDYCSDAWNLYELLVHAVSIALIAAWLVFVTNSQRVLFDVSSDEPVSYRDVVRQYSIASDLAGLLFALSAAKAFKFLQALDKRMAVLWLTLQRSSVDAALFMIGFVCIMVGFSFAGVHLFGPYVQQFQDVSAAMATLVQMTVGEVDYEDLVGARPAIAPWFVSIYLFLCSLLFANLLIAIVNRSFETISEEIQFDETWKEGLPDLRLELFMTCRRSCRRVKNMCPCCYRVFCCTRANTAKQLKTQQERRSAAISKGKADKKGARLQELDILPENRRAVKAGVRIKDGETLDAWMVRKLLQGRNDMKRVRQRAQDILDDDERLRNKPTLTRRNGSTIGRQREGHSRWRLGSSRSMADDGTAATGGAINGCCATWFCCCCCYGRNDDDHQRGDPSGAADNMTDLYEQPGAMSMSMLGISTAAAANSRRVVNPADGGEDNTSGLQRAASSSSLRDPVALISGRKRRTLPTDRTLFHAVRAESEAVAAAAAAEMAELAEDSGKQQRQPHRASALRGTGSMQMRVWEAQEQFLGKMRQAARLARRRPQKSVDLYAYFNAAWMESGGRTIYMTMQELCLLTPGQDGCKHTNCAARQVVDAYQAWKAVILLKGASKKQFSGGKAEIEDSFFVIKVNKAGRKQERLLVVDKARAQLKGFDMQQNLRRMLPLTQLVQIEQSRVDSTRLNLVFSDGVGANWALLFITSFERQRFARLVYKVVSKRRGSGHSRLRMRRATLKQEGGDGGASSKDHLNGADDDGNGQQQQRQDRDRRGPSDEKQWRGSSTGHDASRRRSKMQHEQHHRSSQRAGRGSSMPTAVMGMQDGTDYDAYSRRQLMPAPSGRAMGSEIGGGGYGSELFPPQAQSEISGLGDREMSGVMSASGLIASTASLLQGSASTGMQTPSQRRSFHLLHPSPPHNGRDLVPGNEASPPDTAPVAVRGMLPVPGGGATGRDHRRVHSGNEFSSRAPFGNQLRGDKSSTSGGLRSYGVRIEGVPDDLDQPHPHDQRDLTARTSRGNSGRLQRATSGDSSSARWSHIMMTGKYDAHDDSGLEGGADMTAAAAAGDDQTGGAIIGDPGTSRRVSFAGQGTAPQRRQRPSRAIANPDGTAITTKQIQKAAVTAVAPMVGTESPIDGVGLGGRASVIDGRGSVSGRRRSAVGPVRASLISNSPTIISAGPPNNSMSQRGSGLTAASPAPKQSSARRSSALGLRRPAAGLVLEMSTIQEGSSSVAGSPARGSVSQSALDTASSRRTSGATETSQILPQDSNHVAAVALSSTSTPRAAAAVIASDDYGDGSGVFPEARVAMHSLGDSSSASTRRLSTPHASSPPMSPQTSAHDQAMTTAVGRSRLDWTDADGFDDDWSTDSDASRGDRDQGIGVDGLQFGVTSGLPSDRGSLHAAQHAASSTASSSMQPGGSWGGGLQRPSDRHLPVPAGVSDAPSLGGSLAPPMDVGESLWSEGAMDETGDHSTLNGSGNSGGVQRPRGGGGIDAEVAGDRHRSGGAGAGGALPAMVGTLASSRSLGASLVGRQAADSGASDAPMVRHRVTGMSGHRNRSFLGEFAPARHAPRRIGDVSDQFRQDGSLASRGNHHQTAQRREDASSSRPSSSMQDSHDVDDSGDDSDAPRMRELGVGGLTGAVLDGDDDGEDALSNGSGLVGVSQAQRRVMRRATLRVAQASARVGWGSGLLREEEEEEEAVVSDDGYAGSHGDRSRDDQEGLLYDDTGPPQSLPHPATSRRRLRMISGDEDDD